MQFSKSKDEEHEEDHVTEIDGHKFKPETLVLGYGYNNKSCNYSLKPPLFLTSTFVFPKSKVGKRAFELMRGVAKPRKGEKSAYVYSRMNNPNLDIFEKRLALFDQSDYGLSFASGMAAVSAVPLAFCRPGDALISTDPIYGGSKTLFNYFLNDFGIKVYWVPADAQKEEIEKAILAAQNDGRKVKVIYTETPSNPTIVMTDLEALNELKLKYSTPENKIVLACDNTFLGKLFLAKSKLFFFFRTLLSDSNYFWSRCNSLFNN